uniref:ubiquitinyl hydrolase 1 n=1 Tax=Pseudictyota dubia TaxID=2749911 RepID=A0A7R9W9B5_9STRA
MTKFKGMFQGKDAVSRVVAELHAFLIKDSIRNMTKFPKYYEDSKSRNVVVLRRPTSHAQHRLWVVPRVSDYSQDNFSLDIQNCQSVNIPMVQLQAFASKPLAPIKLESFVQYLSRGQRHLPLISSALPFQVGRERATKTHCSEATLQRITSDVRKYADKENAETEPSLIGLSPSDVASFHGNPGGLSKAQGQLTSLMRSLNASMDFDRKSLANLMHRALAIVTSDERSDTPYSGGAAGECNFLRFRLGQCAEKEPSAWFELLVASILSTGAEADVRALNPYLTGTAYKTVTSLTVVAMLTSIRISQSHRVLTGLAKLMLLLRKVKGSDDPHKQRRVCQEISLQASQVATNLTCERHFMKVDPSAITFDPRYLVFEFTYSLLLRKSQVVLVNKFMRSLNNGKSMCHQMIMGAGKTTVVAPLLALMLADGKSLVTQVVPHALLEMSRGVMREKFAAVVRKPVFTFAFDRGTTVSRDLYMKLVKARDSKAIICATPTSIKSFMLKFVEMMRVCENVKSGGKRSKTKESWFSLSAIARKFREASVVTEMKVNPEDAFYCTEILKLFRNGVLLLDEVDLLLHPLKSELNWPLGQKDPIDFSRSKKFGVGLRWQAFWHILDAVFYASRKKMTVPFSDSREALHILEKISKVIQQGIETQQLQHTPHLVILDKKFYHKELKQLMAQWQLLFLRSKRLPSVKDTHLLSYMVNGPEKDKEAASAVSVALDDEFMKMLNLSYELIGNFVPHVLSKINRVKFGLLSKSDLKVAMETDPNISLTRRLAAVPFVGKDVPSRASQFSHPDVVIGLTILAFRYEGLRYTDFTTLITELRETLDTEIGPYHKRPSALRYKSWVEEAGGKVRGPKEGEEKNGENGGSAHGSGVDEENSFFMSPVGGASRGNPTDEIWPLHLLDVKDDQHMGVTYRLLHDLPNAIEYYLDSFVFPLTMEHHQEKINASGQDLGGEMLFAKRVGFSGTPSDLLPEELGQCQYDEGVDGQIINYLTSESIVSSRLLGADWSVRGILDQIATNDPPFHVLIDTGALITGMSNFDVAKYLINGLPKETFDGVVFLDHKDRKMILLRQGMSVVRLNQAGIPPERRFSFYDQIHTTGMDIHQCIDARAATTLGKDMTFRDYAQGAFRMRGIGKGQTIELFVIPEVMKLIEKQVKRSQQFGLQPAPPPPPANPLGGGGGDLLSLAAPTPNPSHDEFAPVAARGGVQLLRDVTAWLTVNGMKSENMQFRMLCQQSVDNVMRKRAFRTLTGSYKELTQLAFAGRVKEIAAVTAALASNAGGDMAMDLDGLFDGSRKLFADDMAEIRDVMTATANRNTPTVGIDKLQRCLDVMGERIDYTVQNSIPMPRPLSETLRNEVTRRQEFIVNDYDKAVVERIIMVLVNSENLVRKQLGAPTAAEEAEEKDDHNLQREQVAEEEVLQEQEEEEEEEEADIGGGADMFGGDDGGDY